MKDVRETQKAKSISKSNSCCSEHNIPISNNRHSRNANMGNRVSTTIRRNLLDLRLHDGSSNSDNLLHTHERQIRSDSGIFDICNSYKIRSTRHFILYNPWDCFRKWNTRVHAPFDDSSSNGNRCEGAWSNNSHDTIFNVFGGFRNHNHLLCGEVVEEALR